MTFLLCRSNPRCFLSDFELNRRRIDRWQRHLLSFAAMQAEIKNGVIKKVEETTEKREAYLKTMRDRLREKSQRVEEVKMTKKMAQEKSIPSPQSVTVAN